MYTAGALQSTASLFRDFLLITALRHRERSIARYVRAEGHAPMYVYTRNRSPFRTLVYVHAHACEWDFYRTAVKMHTLIDNPDRFVACWHTNAICAIPVNPFPFANSKDSDRTKFGETNLLRSVGEIVSLFRSKPRKYRLTQTYRTILYLVSFISLRLTFSSKKEKV